MNQTTFTIAEDQIKKVEFWLEALSNPNVDAESKKMLNECLRHSLNTYMKPIVFVKHD